MNLSAKRLVELLQQKNQTLAVVESLTGGQCASAMTSIPGASTVFVGGLIPYQTEQKSRLLGLDAQRLIQEGAVSAWCAAELATKGKDFFQSDYVLAFTGNAGPNPMEHKPIGLVYVALASSTGVSVKPLHLVGTRPAIQAQAVEVGFHELLKLLQSF